MIKLNRTTEYGLIALRHISRKHLADPKEVTSAREIATSYGLPFEITAKTLQRLKESGLIQSAHGARGGYTLQRSLKEVSLAEFLELMEGPQSLVVCAGSSTSLQLPTVANASSNSSDNPSDEHGACEYLGRCEIKHLMGQLNARVFNFLSGIQLAEVAEGYLPPFGPLSPLLQIALPAAKRPVFQEEDKCLK
jgi:Rrf2 family protein